MSQQTHSPYAKQLTQVTLATLLVAGTPVAAVWWLRGSGTIDSAAITVALGVVISLLTSWAGRIVWERHQGSEDLLFNELMVWGYLHRLRTQRRLGSAAELAAQLAVPGHARKRSDPAAVRSQTRLLERLVAGMETRDPYLHGHSRRVARHAWMIARHMRLPAEEVARVRTAAALHDVGKTKTPKTILHKAGGLTDEEYRIIKLHPGEGAEMTAVLGDPELTAMIRDHHERLDGSGYPDGLTGDQIPLGARIIAVADTFDAITSARPYRAASPHRKAIDILRGEAQTKLDPDAVRAFCGHYAGRGPLALWSFVCSLPERMLSWLSASAASVASAAKVVAVAALVGGVAATSSTFGVAGASGLRARYHEHPAARAATGSSVAALTANRASRNVSAVTVHPKRGAASHRGKSHSRAPGAAPAPGAVTPHAPAAGAVVQGTVAGPARSDERTSAGSGGGEEKPSAPVQTGSPKPVRQEAPAKGKSEAPAKGKSEEAPAKGKSEEAPAKGKSEETKKVEEHSPPGKSEEPSGTPEERTGKGGSGNAGSGKPEAQAGGKGQSGASH